MELIVDFTVLAASGAAAFYCFVLSGRLRRLNDTKTGLGAGIAAMTVTLEQTKSTLAESVKKSFESEARLRSVLEEADRLIPEVAELLDALLEASDTAARDAVFGRTAAADALSESTEGSRRIEPVRRARKRPQLAA